jgi:large subunit ribosomal protein L25
METIPLAVTMRDAGGKREARALRREGRVPGVLYGPKRTVLSVTLDAKEFSKKVATVEGSHLLRLESNHPELSGRLAIVKEMQRDPISTAVVHADLYEVDLETKLRVRVALHFVGKADGVEKGGILQPIQRDVSVLCLPTDIPDFIEVDVSPLGIHEAVHLSELTVPSGVELEYDKDEPVVTVLPPTVEEAKVAAPAEGAVAEGAAPAAEAAKTEPAGKDAAKGG